jgi:hypothetical protein
MTDKNFRKPPLSPLEKEKKAEEFIGFLENSQKTPENGHTLERKLEKELMKSFPFRIPFSLYDDLREIAALTGISINAICLELLRPCVKRKLKELKESG